MKLSVSVLCIGIFLSFAQLSVAQFEIIGDLFRDNINQREWVRLYVTAGMSFEEVQSETESGGDFEGFQVAASQDFVELAGTYNFNGLPLLPELPLHSPDYPAITLTQTSLECLFGNGFLSIIGGEKAILASELSAPNEKDAFRIDIDEPIKIYVTESFEPSFSDSSYGVMLYRDFCAVCDPLLGDVNLDGQVNLLDVTPFVARISNGEFQPEADINQDNVVDLLDVNPFVGLLAG